MMRVVGCYAEEPEEIELAGTAQGLRELAAVIGGDVSSSAHTLYDTSNSSPAPYTAFLSALRIGQGAGAVSVYREGNVLTISGSKEMLTVLAENISSLANEADTTSGISPHLHIEYFPGHYFLAPNAVPLVVSLEQSLEDLRVDWH